MNEKLKIDKWNFSLSVITLENLCQRLYKFGLVVMVVLCVAGCVAPKAKQSDASITPVPPYICQYVAEGSIVIDGKLNEPAWTQSEAITEFNIYSPKDAVSISPTAFKLVWSDSHLYASFVCEDDDIWPFSSEPDVWLWQGDVVELFIKPSRESSEFYEFVVAPNGALYDARYTSRGAGGIHRFNRWDSQARIATVIHGTVDVPDDTDRSYTVEMAIPLTAFKDAPLPGDKTVWTFGAFRYDYSKSFDAPLLLMSIPESLKRGFHYYEGYRELMFSPTLSR